MSGPVVKIEQGRLVGKKINKNCFIFKGIPYAVPPVGDLRFSVPVPPEPWYGIRDATKDCNVCAQIDIHSSSVIGSEDCLYLHVTTPKLYSNNLLPVMVFIHGGGFFVDTGTDTDLVNLEYLVEKDVVGVSFNYRLGILGFLSLDRKDAPGNMGLRDQVQALKWVQKNIKHFGGDPKNVTIFGIGAGGVSVEYLMLSPMAKGLFHKAIAQSGSSLLPWAQSGNSRELAMKIPTMRQIVINNDVELLKYLKEMSIEDLVVSVVKAMQIYQNRKEGLYFGFVPTIEKPKDWEPFLDTSSYDLLLRGQFTKVPFITGFCKYEGHSLLAVQKKKIDALAKERDFENYVSNFFNIDSNEIDKVATALTDVYLNKLKYDEPDSFAKAFFRDLDFIGGIYTAAFYIAKHNSSIYFYEFAYDGNLNYKPKLFLSQSAIKTDELVKERLFLMWTNFAKYGEPTPVINELIPTKWEPIGSNMAYLVIDKYLTMKQDPYPERTQVLKNLYDTYHSKKSRKLNKL